MKTPNAQSDADSADRCIKRCSLAGSSLSVRSSAVRRTNRAEVNRAPACANSMATKRRAPTAEADAVDAADEAASEDAIAVEKVEAKSFSIAHEIKIKKKKELFQVVGSSSLPTTLGASDERASTCSEC